MMDKEFLGELALAAQTDREKKDAALRVLMDYMIYTGIAIRVDGGLLLASTGEKVLHQSGSSEKAEDIVWDSPSDHSSSGRSETGTTWHTIQTEDFNLRIRSDIDAFDDLQEHIQTLKRKVERLRNKQQVTVDA